MKIIDLNLSRKPGFKIPEPLLLFVVGILSWPLLQYLIIGLDERNGAIDPNIWLLVLLSLISFIVIVGLAWWLLKRFWTALGLPGIGSMVVQFKTMESWQQLGFYWLSFALLLLAAVGCLIAIC